MVVLVLWLLNVFGVLGSLAAFGPATEPRLTSLDGHREAHIAEGSGLFGARSRRHLGIRLKLNMKTNGKKHLPALAKGQLWRTGNGHIRIVELGKMLVHYKMLRDLRQMRRTQTSSIDNMEDYLKTNRAKLVENSAVAA